LRKEYPVALPLVFPKLVLKINKGVIQYTYMGKDALLKAPDRRETLGNPSPELVYFPGFDRHPTNLLPTVVPFFDYDRLVRNIAVFDTVDINNLTDDDRPKFQQYLEYLRRMSLVLYKDPLKQLQSRSLPVLQTLRDNTNGFREGNGTVDNEIDSEKTLRWELLKTEKGIIPITDSHASTWSLLKE
jgi:hypothetical protein